MSEILTAIYQDGAFVPEQATHFAPGARVRIVVEPLGEKLGDAVDDFDAILDELTIDSSGSRLTRDELRSRVEEA